MRNSLGVEQTEWLVTESALIYIYIYISLHKRKNKEGRTKSFEQLRKPKKQLFEL